MFLQAAIDAPSLTSAGASLRKLSANPSIDRIEIGSPLLSHYGVRAARYFLASIAPSRLYADTKLIDFPAMELAPYIKVGIRRFSAMAFMNDDSFQELRSLTDSHGLELFVSTMGFPLALLARRAALLRDLGFTDFICHGAGCPEVAFADTLARADTLRNVPGLRLVAAGGINTSNAHRLKFYDLTGLIVGRGLQARSVVDIAARIKSDAIGR